MQTDSNYEKILQAISMRGAGHVIGGIVGMCCMDQISTRLVAYMT